MHGTPPPGVSIAHSLLLFLIARRVRPGTDAGLVRARCGMSLGPGEHSALAWAKQGPTMEFDKDVRKTVRQAVAEGQWHLLYVMVPAQDGGQTYEMKCKICGEFGNVLASEFIHADGCPVDVEEKTQRKR